MLLLLFMVMIFCCTGVLGFFVGDVDVYISWCEAVRFFKAVTVSFAVCCFGAHLPYAVKQLRSCGNGSWPGEALILERQTAPDENLPIAHLPCLSPEFMLGLFYHARCARRHDITATRYAQWSE